MMEEKQDSSLLSDTACLANDGERATLTRQSRNAYRNSSIEREITPKLELSNVGESSTFWALIGVLIILATANLSLTFFAMGVLRLSTGMESIEFIPGTKIIKFFGLTDLGNLQKKDGLIYSYSDVPFSVIGDNSKVSLTLRTKSEPPVLEVSPRKTEIRNVDRFNVHKSTGESIFSTEYPSFGLPKGVKNLNVKRSTTSRITSPTFSDLEVHADSIIRVKGNEGVAVSGGKVTLAALHDLYLKTLNGSVVLSGSAGIYVEVNTLPLVDPVNLSKDRGQYKLCLCQPKGQLFRVPVPADNHLRSPDKQITCSTFTSPCQIAHQEFV